MAEPLIINGFDEGIADSPHKGFGLMRNVDIEAFPGAAKVKPAPISVFHTALSASCTGVVDTDVLTLATGTVPATKTAVKPTSTVSGVTANTVYFINKISGTTFYLYNTIANADAGTATGRIDITATTSFTIATVNPGTINHIIKDPRTGTRFMQDSNGRVWYLASGGSQAFLLFNSVLDNAVAASGNLGSAAGNGIVLYKQNDSNTTHWLLAFRNAVIDIIDIYATADIETPSWTNTWDFGGTATDSTLNSGASSDNRHHAIVGQDDIVYFTDGRFVGSIKEASGSTFAAGTTSTYTGNDQALDTPTSEVLVHLEELGTNLLAASSTSNNIYPWDRISDSFNLPLKVPENNVQRLKNIGNTVYILVGIKGNIYTTQGSTVRFFKKIPEYLTNNAGSMVATPITWGGIDQLDGALLFGMSVQTSGNSGVYKLFPDGKLVIDQIPTTAGNVTAFETSAGANMPYCMGFASGADVHRDSRYSALEAKIQSRFYEVATKAGKGTYSSLEVVTATPATTGAQIRVRYRTDKSTAFGTGASDADILATYTADSSATTYQTDIGLMNIENIQIQAEFDDDIELLEVRLLP